MTAPNLAARRLLAVLLVAVAVMTLAGYLLKAQCVGHYNERRDSNLCSNDIQVLYLVRDLAHHPFPYVHGKLVEQHQADGTVTPTLTGGTLEYPVLTGLFAWFTSLFVDDDGSYLRLSALFLAPFSFLTVWLLSRMVRWRALLYALAPPLVWYSFHNWDLLVVCATVASFHAWWRQRYVAAGVFLAVGTSLKFWPIFFVLPLLLDRWTARDRRGTADAALGFAWVFGIVNGFFVLASPQGWYAPYGFQKLRAADITSNSIWYWGLPDLTTDQLNVLIPVLLLIGTAVACWWGVRRARHEGVFPFVQVCGALLALFMVTGKAHSPQYALWLLPFFCLVRLRWGWFAAYMAIDVLMYVGIFRWYYALGQPDIPDYGLAYQSLVLGIWGRAVMLVLLFVVMLRAEPAFEPLPSEDDHATTLEPSQR